MTEYRHPLYADASARKRGYSEAFERLHDIVGGQRNRVAYEPGYVPLPLTEEEKKDRREYRHEADRQRFNRKRRKFYTDRHRVMEGGFVNRYFPYSEDPNWGEWIHAEELERPVFPYAEGIVPTAQLRTFNNKMDEYIQLNRYNMLKHAHAPRDYWYNSVRKNADDTEYLHSAYVGQRSTADKMRFRRALFNFANRYRSQYNPYGRFRYQKSTLLNRIRNRELHG